MSTPNLGIAHLVAAQNQPEVTVNAALDALDDSINLEAAVALTDADTTLTQAQVAAGGVLKFTGALTADRHINLPATIGRAVMVINATTGGHNLIVQVTGAPGTTVTVSAALGLIEIYSDGTNVTQLTGAGSVPVPNFADDETPGGTINGSNTAFTLAYAPSPAGSLLLFRNGVLQIAGTDYTLSGLNITAINVPQTGDILRAWYRH